MPKPAPAWMDEVFGKGKVTPVLTALGHKIPAGALTVTTAQQLAAIAGHDPTLL
ncbi:hypothetical protein [Streptomyces sp. NPDC058297]|uniref:hypothetical protein n=1 Tax=Streptomyces sp. NPDC058297 TaxID=3346433 RepID=UPI0036EFFC87